LLLRCFFDFSPLFAIQYAAADAARACRLIRFSIYYERFLLRVSICHQHIHTAIITLLTHRHTDVDAAYMRDHEDTSYARERYLLAMILLFCHDIRHYAAIIMRVFMRAAAMPLDMLPCPLPCRRRYAIAITPLRQPFLPLSAIATAALAYMVRCSPAFRHAAVAAMFSLLRHADAIAADICHAAMLIILRCCCCHYF